MSSSKTQAELLGRLFGILVFLIGIGLLGIVFWTAWNLFKAPVNLPTNAAGIGAVLANLAKQVIFLILMTALASVIASRGLTLYYAANPWTDTPGKPGAPSRNGKSEGGDLHAVPAGSRRASEPSEA